jgi:1-acyl-sn-glycerol-3-phosphate acyltransferase
MAQMLIRKLAYGWRLIGTGLSFSTFGIGGLILWFVLFPLLALFPGNRMQRIARAQQAVHYSFYLFIGFMHRVGIMTYEINGLEKLNRPGQLIIANHPTLVDIVFLISRVRQANCIVKHSLWHNPFMRGPILNAGYISNGDPETMISECVDWLKGGGCMIIFPEGTRSVSGKPYHFQRGAFAIALAAGVTVTPVTISCYPSTLTKAEQWYEIPERHFHLAMHVGEDVDLASYQAIEPKSIAVRRLTSAMQDYFTQQRERYRDYGK